MVVDLAYTWYYEQLEVGRQGGVEHEVLVCASMHARRWGLGQVLRARGQERPLPRRWIDHAVIEHEEAVAVVADVDDGEAVGVGVAGHRVVEPAGDGGAHGGASEELREPQTVQVEEDAAQRAREEVGAQQAAVVDDAAPRPADAAGRGEAAGREAAEDAREHVVGQRRRRRVHRLPWQSPAGETSTDPLRLGRPDRD